MTLVGDAELDEGSNHEAIVVAARAGLENLTTVVIDNRSSTRGWPGGIARRFDVEGWETRTVSGRDHDALVRGLHHRPPRPAAGRGRRRRTEGLIRRSDEGNFLATTEEILDADPDVAVVLADISAAQLAGAARRHPDRVINVGIREQLLVSTGAGLALAGLRPIVHTFPSFLVERAFEQIKLDFSHQEVGGVLVSYGASYDMSDGRAHAPVAG